MKKYRTLKAERHVNPISECFCHFVDTKIEAKYVHDHEFYELFIVVKGSVVHYINGIRHSLTEGTLVFIRPSDAHTYEELPGEHATLINIAFSENVVNSLFEYLTDDFPSKRLLSQSLPPMKVLTNGDKDWVLKHFERCYTINWQEPKQLKIYTRTLLAEIFQRYFYEVSDDDTSIPEWLVDLCQQMNKPENFRLGTDRMIELSGKTREHLARSLKKYMELSMTDYINELRINYAANMLISSHIPILDICYDLGYQNLGWFYNQFKKKYGISPKQFRDKYSPLNS